MVNIRRSDLPSVRVFGPTAALMSAMQRAA
jgi:hypothetical protein